ncbi:metallophosphoesterase family protein [Acidilobus saccharovorans]|uniref:metallophosphoesterase family protein n=1 Tax=Acidilobus saccharovorans TaxID=242703 RepID=UPI00066224DD|nr:metallophosphoesterase family protein [Acidilobus saccharovorans]
MKATLVLADVHYPHTDLKLLRWSLEEEHDSVVLLGDSVDLAASLPELLRLVGNEGSVPVTLVRGDNEEALGIGGVDFYSALGGRVLMVHGHQGNVANESFTKFAARLAARVSRRLVLSVYAMRLHRPGVFVVAGHAHALWYSRAFRVAIVGSLSTKSSSRPFNEQGYAILSGESLTLKVDPDDLVVSIKV